MEAKKTTAKKSPAKKAAPKPKAEKPKEEKKETVAVFSEGKLFHPSVGRLNQGYNIVSYDAAQEWMKISKRVREATPQEVASAYGV
jgi:hypothetical protein